MTDWTVLSTIIAIALMIVVMGAAAAVLWLIFRGHIDLTALVHESDSKKASLSRFQFLLFTFVIAGLVLMLSFEAGALVRIPDSVLILLGISAASYAISKFITAHAGARNQAHMAATLAAAAQASAAADAAQAHAAQAKQAAADAAKQSP